MNLSKRYKMMNIQIFILIIEDRIFNNNKTKHINNNLFIISMQNNKKYINNNSINKFINNKIYQCYNIKGCF